MTTRITSEPLIGSTVTPYFDLAIRTTYQVAPPLPSVQLHTEACDFSQEDRSDDTQYEEELQCTSCPDIFLPANCMARVQAFIVAHSTTVEFGAALYIQLISVAASRLARRPIAASGMGRHDLLPGLRSNG